ncbi:MAG: hypothetical protein J6N18_07235 [Kiritimatiellae bacterium]|nr:hypothetical protein [Kiritimatiellia bacterium]
MVKIFSGDDTNFRDDQRLALTFSAPDVDFEGCTAELEFLGHRRVFPSVSDGGRLSFSFSADETRGMPVGVHRVTICLRDASGRVRTIDNTQRIKVTDDVNEAYGDAEQELKVSVVGASGGASLPEIPNFLSAEPSDSIGDFKAKYNRLLDVLRGVAVVLAVLACFPVSAQVIEIGGTPAYGPLNDLPGTTPIMTNVVDYIEGELWELQQRGINASKATALGSWGVTVGMTSWGLVWNADTKRLVASWNYLPDIGRETVAYASDVTNIVRETQGTVWDDALGVAWQARMHNGHLYYIAVTNQPPEVK